MTMTATVSQQANVNAERLEFRGLRLATERTFSFQPRELIVAGWAGRDAAAMEAHIHELEEIGVARPRMTPMYYRVAASLLTQADAIEVVGTASSGECEVVLLHNDDGHWIALGSDHTDRKLETVGVTLSKQVCAKPVSRECWHLDDVRNHWDDIVLRSSILEGGRIQVYQEGLLSTLTTPEDLLRRFTSQGGRFPVGAAMFCGTVPVQGGLRFSERVTLELVDPVLKRRLTHSYAVQGLEIAD
jgi:hypothetical protein